jgi:hypothetical protein
MSLNGNGTKFVGDDGFVKEATFGAEIAGDGATPLPAPGTYLVIKVAGASAFPAPASGGDSIAVGDILVLETGDALTPAIDDDVVTLSLADQCDVSSWAMEFSKEEIDTTTLCNSVKTYRAGKSDMAGTMNGVFMAGTTDSTTGALREFIRIAQQDEVASFDSFAQRESITLGFFYVNDDVNIADKMYVVAGFQQFGLGLGGEIGSAQSFSSSFRFADYAYTTVGGLTVTISPTFYRLGS